MTLHSLRLLTLLGGLMLLIHLLIKRHLVEPALHVLASEQLMKSADQVVDVRHASCPPAQAVDAMNALSPASAVPHATASVHISETVSLRPTISFPAAVAPTHRAPSGWTVLLDRRAECIAHQSERTAFAV